MDSNELQKNLQDFEASEEFDYLMSGYQNDYEINNKPVPSQQELRREVLHDYEQRLLAEEQCKAEGHQWEDINCDGENGSSDLECQRCGLTHHIQW